METNYVRVRLRCNLRHQELEVCVPVNRGVPDPLRCTPGGGGVAGGGGGGASPLCPEYTALLQGDRLSRRVDELTRRGWAEHVKAGAVVLTC